MKKRMLGTLLAAVMLISNVTVFAEESGNDIAIAEESGSVPLAPSTADLWDGTIAKSFDGGNGTEDDPYVISTAEALAYLASEVNSGQCYNNKYFSMTNDLNLDNIAWTPIGDFYNPFNGIFDGNNYTVYNLSITNPNVVSIEGHYWHDQFATVGLFGHLDGENGTIKNLSVTGNVKIVNKNANERDDIIAGGICGYARGCIENCHNYCSVYGYSDGLSAYVNVGGVCGTYCMFENNNVIIDSCSNAGEIIGISPWVTRVAGVCGDNDGGGTVINCWNTGNVYAQGVTSSNKKVETVAGGIAAHTYDSNVINCYNLGNITAEKGKAGGITGYQSGTGADVYANCYSTGEVTGKNAGGITGTIWSCGKIINCFYLSKQSVTSYNLNKAGIILNCYEINEDMTVKVNGVNIPIYQEMNAWASENYIENVLIEWQDVQGSMPILMASDTIQSSDENYAANSEAL